MFASLRSNGDRHSMIHIPRLARRATVPVLAVLVASGGSRPVAAQQPALDPLLGQVTAEVEQRAKLTQVIVDKLFSFGELGFQEVETALYLTGLLRSNGFEVQEGIAGIPTAWIATWGSGAPVIAFGSDVDGIPKASQKPGVAFHAPIVPGAPGHGEGHNAGQAVNITAALALKEVMERERIPGTLVLWPGVAEELLASKAWLVREGVFREIDVVLATHVGSSFGVSWGRRRASGLVSVEFSFSGESAHGASAWDGRSALDAVELMNIGWNYRREHLRPEQRSHYVITDGGDQPNVVPSTASVWYFLRELDYAAIRTNFEIGTRIAEGAARMTHTEVSHRVLGAAWPIHFNRPLAEVMHRHVREVGLPAWTPEDQALARAVQKLVRARDTTGLAMRVDSIVGPQPLASGGSDDIGDVSWVVPTVLLNFPSNIPGATFHHWSSAIAMATPIAHKGASAGAKVLARTALETILRPDLVSEAWSYFRDVQGKEATYTPLIGPTDPPPIWLNREAMAEFAPRLRPFHYDETRYDTYLEQLGIEYPTLGPK